MKGELHVCGLYRCCVSASLTHHLSMSLASSVFFGLGTCIKYPSNFEESPYTIIATGTPTLRYHDNRPLCVWSVYVNLPRSLPSPLSPLLRRCHAAPAPQVPLLPCQHPWRDNRWPQSCHQ